MSHCGGLEGWVHPEGRPKLTWPVPARGAFRLLSWEEYQSWRPTTMAKATATAKTAATATGYCMKCKASREITNAKPITMKNGRPATEGTCPVCSTKMFKIGASK